MRPSLRLADLIQFGKKDGGFDRLYRNCPSDLSSSDQNRDFGNFYWTTIDTPDCQSDDQRLTVTINSHVHEFPSLDGLHIVRLLLPRLSGCRDV